jgi:hypothetical protein
MNIMPYNTWLTDSDIDEMFPNFPTEPKIRPRAGVDLKALHCLSNYYAPMNDDEEYRWESLFI